MMQSDSLVNTVCVNIVLNITMIIREFIRVLYEDITLRILNKVVNGKLPF